MAPSTLQQAAGHLHILLLHGLQVPHGGRLGLRMGRLGHALVDHGAEILPGQLCQIHELLLSDIPQEGGDLGVVDNTRQGDPLPGGEDQRVEPHGHHCLHPAEGADDGPGAAGIVQEIVGDRQPAGGQLARTGVQMLFHRHEHRRQAIGAVGVFRRRAEEGGLLFKPLPPPQGKAEVIAVGRDTGAQQHAVGLVVRGLLQDQRRVRSQQDPADG